MGDTYWITGTQIGIIYAMLDMGKPHEIRKLLQEILDKQITSREARKESKRK